MKRFDVEQLSDQWFELHRGRLTASRADKLVTPKQGKVSASLDDLVCELIGEKLSLVAPLRKPANGAMQAGIEREPESRNWLELELGRDIEQVGFITTDDERYGCSPDGLVRLDGKLYGVELKNPQPKEAVRWALAGTLPDEYRPQVHTCLHVADETHGWIFASYCPPFSFWVIEHRNGYTDLIRAALELFWERYQAVLAKFTRSAA